MTDKEVMQMALDALECWQRNEDCNEPMSKILEALRAALAQPEPDYEAEFIKDWNEGKVRRVSDGKRMVPEREWQGLTEEEKVEIQMLKWWDWEDTFDLDGYTRAIEAKLKEKNG